MTRVVHSEPGRKILVIEHCDGSTSILEGDFDFKVEYLEDPPSPLPSAADCPSAARSQEGAPTPLTVGVSGQGASRGS